jgi:hypothetical protein
MSFNRSAGAKIADHADLSGLNRTASEASFMNPDCPAQS